MNMGESLGWGFYSHGLPKMAREEITEARTPQSRSWLPG